MMRRISIIYHASMDYLTIITTILPLFFMAFIGFTIFHSFSVEKDFQSAILMTVLSFIIVSALIYSWLLAPVSYTVDDNYFTVNRRINTVKFRIDDLTEIRALDTRELRFVFRTFGVGGIFGHYGKYFSSSFGKLTFYATRLSKRILIKTRQGENIIITPDQKEIINDLQFRIDNKNTGFR